MFRINLYRLSGLTFIVAMLKRTLTKVPHSGRRLTPATHRVINIVNSFLHCQHADLHSTDNSHITQAHTQTLMFSIQRSGFRRLGNTSFDYSKLTQVKYLCNLDSLLIPQKHLFHRLTAFSYRTAPFLSETRLTFKH